MATKAPLTPRERALKQQLVDAQDELDSKEEENALLRAKLDRVSRIVVIEEDDSDDLVTCDECDGEGCDTCDNTGTVPSE